jgi:hypothetical protein
MSREVAMHLEFTRQKITRQLALGAAALIASWALGTAALDYGLAKDGAGVFGPAAFLAACALWLYSRRSLKDLPRIHIIDAVLLSWWSLNLALSAAAGGSDVYRTAFFTISSAATAALITYSLLTVAVRHIAPTSHLDESHVRS